MKAFGILGFLSLAFCGLLVATGSLDALTGPGISTISREASAVDQDNGYGGIIRQMQAARTAQAQAAPSVKDTNPDQARSRLGAAAFNGALLFGGIALLSGVVRLAIELRAIKKERGYLLSRPFKIAIIGVFLWWMILGFLQADIASEWFDDKKGRLLLWGILPPVLSLLSWQLAKWAMRHPAQGQK